MGIGTSCTLSAKIESTLQLVQKLILINICIFIKWKDQLVIKYISLHFIVWNSCGRQRVYTHTYTITNCLKLDTCFTGASRQVGVADDSVVLEEGPKFDKSSHNALFLRLWSCGLHFCRTRLFLHRWSFFYWTRRIGT